MVATVEGIYIAPESAAPMQPLQQATLIKNVGIEGDRYALKTGTYSLRILGSEPGINVTMISADGVEETMKKENMEPFTADNTNGLKLGILRRNIVLRGISAEDLNNMQGWEVKIGEGGDEKEEGGGVRLFLHRRTVPCKYREAQNKRPGLQNKLFDVCGMNCEILHGGVIKIGDKVEVVPDTYDPWRCNPGVKPPAHFIKPSERTAEQARGQIMPTPVALVLALLDPVGFKRIEAGYNSAGQHFFSPKAYRAGLLGIKIRVPLLVAVGAAFVAMIVQIGNRFSK
mmetsp:Transcript_16986/g.23316  ORF Transcript_16986/g.23316 Transcript_16986/m.23316 type:complete len:285 (-) Transcript_16986:159-1013(-)